MRRFFPPGMLSLASPFFRRFLTHGGLRRLLFGYLLKVGSYKNPSYRRDTVPTHNKKGHSALTHFFHNKNVLYIFPYSESISYYRVHSLEIHATSLFFSFFNVLRTVVIITFNTVPPLNQSWMRLSYPRSPKK